MLFFKLSKQLILQRFQIIVSLIIWFVKHYLEQLGAAACLPPQAQKVLKDYAS